METQIENCSGCQKEIPLLENSYFCPFCASQLKCKNCKGALIPNSKACMYCGCHVTKMVNADGAEVVMNEFEFEQKGDSKKFKSRFSNEVGSVFAEAFGVMFGSAQAARLHNPFANSPAKGVKATIALKSKVDPEESIIETGVTVNGILARVFKIEDNKLKLINSRLKQTGKLDQSIRLAILTLYSYELIDQEEVDKTVISEMLGFSNLYDPHFLSWLSKCDEIIKNGNKLQLSVPGREVAQEILKEVANESLEKGVIVFSKTGKGVKRKRSKNGTNQQASENTTAINSRKKVGPNYYLDLLINEGFFAEKKES